MKKLNVIRCIFLIIMFLVPFFGLVRAQTCDSNVLKALEQTRVTYFDKVTTGEVGSLSIKYPIDGVTYTFTDQGGTSFSYTHSGGSNSVDVSVGVVNAERKFALKAKKGDCVYQTSFIYKLTPVTTLGIAVRIEHEWCNGAGALYYKIVGGDTTKYDFYHRLQGGAYDGLPSPVGGVTTLTEGTYEVKAEPKAGSGAPAVAPVSGLQIRSLKQTVDYTLTDLPSKCIGQQPGLRVNVTSGSYPLLFSLYDNTGTTPVPGFYRQTSNVFTNVPPGNYKVKVEDFCAITGGAATVKGHVVTNTMIDFTETYLNTMQEYGCDYLSFSQLGIKGDNLRPAFEAGSLPFPFTLKFELKEPAPSTIVHTVSRTFNNQNDVSLFLYAHPYVTNLLLVRENLRGERIPKKAGQWEIKAIVSACGTDKTLTAKTVTFKSLFDDFAVYEGGASETTACHSTNIVLSNTTRMDMSIDIYVVVDQAPAGFKYEEAGFFKLTTSNPLLHNKYVKKIHYYGAANNAYPIVAPEFISQGDQFKFRVVDAECDPDRNSGELPLTITHPTNNEPTDLWIHNTQSCRGVTSTGAPYGTFLFSRTRGSEITEIKILSFDGNPSDLPFTLPYTLPISNRINSDTWALYDLPAGKYDISITNRCGNTKVWPNQKLFGETFSFTWSEGCTPSLAAVIGQPEGRAYQSYSVSYFVQHFENGEWKDVERINLNASALSTSYNKTFTETRLKEGKFRVLRKIKYGDNGKICDIVVSEKEYIGDLKNPTAIGAGCPNGKYHIAIIANGGTPPYTYEWVSTTPVGSTTPVPSGHPAQTNDNFFVDLANSDPNTTYTFAVTDACGNRRTVDTSLAGVATPEIKVDAGENAFYCTGQQATLSLPNIKGITVKWYRSDAPSTILGTGNSLTITVAPDDFVIGNTYKVELEMPARPDVASCISDAINNNFAYQFKSKNFVTPIPPTRKDITICAENNTTQDLTQLFQNIPTLPAGVTTTIKDKAGVIYVPDNNTITIGNMKGEYTFVYTLYEPCRKVIGTPVEATLTVNRKINPNTKPNIKICDPSITMDVLKSLVLAGSPEVASLALDFHWYQNNTDAQNQQNESAGSYAISLSPGQKKTLYVRYSKLGYCSGEPKPVEVEREATVAPKALTNPDCSVTTVRTLKALVDPVDSANVIIYKNGTELGDDMLIEEYTPTMYTYSKRLYQCTPPSQALTFSYKERTAAAPQQVGVCTFLGYQNAPYVKVTDIKSKIQAQYVGKTIRIYQNNSELSAANADVNFTATDVYFTVEESGKCPSLQQKVTLQQAPFSVATLLPALSICEDTTIAELKAEIGAQGLSNVKIYSSSLATEESDDKFVVWGNPYYYRVVETGKCPSDLIPLTFTNKGNKTDATPRRFEVCIAQSATAHVSDLKAIITGGDVRIFKRNNDNTWSAPLTDNEAVNENDAYFYTLRASGKCPSDKTPLILAITRKTTTPSSPASGKFCQGKTIADLKDYIDNTVSGTIRVYTDNTSTTPLANTTILTATTYYYSAEVSGHCESDRRAIVIDLVATPTVQSTYTYCIGTKVETLWDAIDSGDSDRSLRIYEVATGGTALSRNTLLRAGNYYVAESSTTSALGNCETTRASLVVVLQNPVAPTVTTPQQFCSGEGKTLADLSTATNLKWYTASTGGTALVATTTLQSATYYASQVVGGCEGTNRTPVVVSVTQTPDKPTVTTEEQCDAVSTAKITNVKPTTEVTTYSFINTVTNATVTATVNRTTGAISGLGVGKYKVTATKDSCDKQSAEFEIKAAKGLPDEPTVTTEEQCDAVSTAKITNVKPTTEVTTYSFINTVTNAAVIATVNRTTGAISGLGVGKYKVTATKDSCDKQSAEFEIKAAKGRPAEPTVTTEEQCDAVSTAKITNVKPTTEVTTYSFINTVTNATVTATVNRTTGAISGLGVGKYKVTAIKDSCDKQSAEFEIKAAKGLPDEPTVTTEDQCDAVSTAKITNVKPTTEVTTYSFINTVTNAAVIATVNRTTGEISGLGVGKYKVTATKDSCDKQSAEFEIKAAKGRPATPIITESAAPTCTSIGVMKISNYDNVSYTFIKSADNTEVTGVTVGTDGVISNLPVGKYKVKATKDGCTSTLSAEFEIEDKEPATAITTSPVGATYTQNATATALSVVSSGTTPTAYKWYRNTTNSKTGSDVTQVATTATYRPLTDQIGSLFYWVELTGCGTVESAIAEIKVTSSAPTITANDDPDTSVAKGGEVEVLSNDRLNGNPVSPTDVDITIPNNGGLTGLTVDATTGKLKVPNTATPGTYEVTYQICVAGGTTTCDTAKVKITVTGTPPPTITANDDPDTSVAKGGEVEVLSNDRLNGNPIAPTDVDITIPNNGGLTGLTADATTGKLKVPNTATPGTYEVTYQICVAGGTTTCDTAKVKITVNGRTIEAHDDGPWKVGTLGGLTPSILNNDILNGSPVSPDQVNIERTNGRPSLTEHFQRNEDGRISVLPQPQGLPRLTAGTYEYYYTIVDKTNSSNAASAKATIIVSDFVAADDVFEFGNPNNRTLTTESVLKNDQVGDKRNPSPTDDVNLTPGTASHPGLTMNADGTITIASGTPNGNYTYTYEICKKAAPSECERAIAYIKLHDSLEANDDDFSSTPVPSSHKTVVGNVLTNNVGGTDKLSGAPISDPTLVELTIVNEGGLTGVELSGNGDISIPAGTPSGRYIVKYRISQVSDRNNYKEAVVTIVVSNEIPLVFHNGISVNGDGKNDGFVIEGIEHYPDNVLRIFNRWGVLVYEKERYGNGEPFVGLSNGRATVSKDTKLPQATAKRKQVGYTLRQNKYRLFNRRGYPKDSLFFCRKSI